MLKKRISVCIFKKDFSLIKKNIGIYSKTNKCGKVIYFSPHIFRGVKLKCAKARFY